MSVTSTSRERAYGSRVVFGPFARIACGKSRKERTRSASTFVSRGDEVAWAQGAARTGAPMTFYFVFFFANAGSFLYTTRRGKFIEWDRILDNLRLRGDESVLDMGLHDGVAQGRVLRDSDFQGPFRLQRGASAAGLPVNGADGERPPAIRSRRVHHLMFQLARQRRASSPTHIWTLGGFPTYVNDVVHGRFAADGTSKALDDSATRALQTVQG